jgi:hypothetical protein
MHFFDQSRESLTGKIIYTFNISLQKAIFVVVVLSIWSLTIMQNLTMNPSLHHAEDSCGLPVFTVFEVYVQCSGCRIRWVVGI